MTSTYSPHQPKGIQPTTSPVAQQLRCPITKRLIAPGEGQHIASKNQDTGATKSFHIHNCCFSSFSPTKKVHNWLASQGLEVTQ